MDQPLQDNNNSTGFQQNDAQQQYQQQQQQQQGLTQQQYAPPPQQQQQIQMSNIPPQQYQQQAPPQNSTLVISYGQQNNMTMQNQQMMFNAQLLQTMQNNQKSNLPSNVTGSTLPVHIYCNSCKQEGVTRVTENPCTVYTWIWFCCCIFSILTLFCFVPGCFKNQHTFTHYCSNCGTKVGEKQGQCT